MNIRYGSSTPSHGISRGTPFGALVPPQSRRNLYRSHPHTCPQPVANNPYQPIVTRFSIFDVLMSWQHMLFSTLARPSPSCTRSPICAGATLCYRMQRKSQFRPSVAIALAAPATSRSLNSEYLYQLVRKPSSYIAYIGDYIEMVASFGDDFIPLRDTRPMSQSCTIMNNSAQLSTSWHGTAHGPAPLSRKMLPSATVIQGLHPPAHHSMPMKCRIMTNRPA
jgi:hypothetical protein